MRRAFLFRRPRALFGLRGLESLRYFLDARAQRADFLLLAKYDIAQDRVGLLEECNLGLNLLERFFVHDSNTANRVKYRKTFV
jgi:hypothetical protein